MSDAAGTFAWVEEARGPDVERSDHVDGIQIMSLMFEASMRYLDHVVTLADPIEISRGRPTLKEMSGRFDSLLLPGEEVRVGVRAASRSDRAFTLEQAVWHADGTGRIAGGTAALVTIDLVTGRAVEVPERLWHAIEKTEGRPIPRR